MERDDGTSLDNEGRLSATTILPELQDLREGGEKPLDLKVSARVARLDPTRTMVRALLEAELELGLTASLTMSYVLDPVDQGCTRLLARCGAGLRAHLRWPMCTCLTSGSIFLMQRKQLLGSKARAEGGLEGC